jgi:AhpD family alkylhydroperoxidase
LPHFPVHTVESAPQNSQNLLRGLKEQVGFVPNLAATMAESPTLLEAFLGLRSVAAGGTLDPVAREIIAIAVASETACDYCVAAHSTFALKSGAAPGVVEAVRSGATPSDPRLEALARFARAVVHRQDDVTERAQDLLDADMIPAQILEALVAIAVPLLASSLLQVAVVKLDGAFQAQAWTRTA